MESEKITVPQPVLSRCDASDVVQPGPSYEMADMSAPTQKSSRDSTTTKHKSWLVTLWQQHVSLTVPAAARRDHLGTW
jgi:hypothetical protein